VERLQQTKKLTEERPEVPLDEKTRKLTEESGVSVVTRRTGGGSCSMVNTARRDGQHYKANLLDRRAQYDRP
jgi:hypothetical protein